MPEFVGPDMSGGLTACGRRVFADLIGKEVDFLEVGVYEGRSGLWLMDNILTHPEASYTGVDNWKEEHLTAKERAVRNFYDGPLDHGHITFYHEDSGVMLPRLDRESFDGIHIDGCHSYVGASADIRNAWPLLRPGGVILCDDYLRADYGVAQAVHEFLARLTIVRDYTPVYTDYSIAWRKT